MSYVLDRYREWQARVLASLRRLAPPGVVAAGVVALLLLAFLVLKAFAFLPRDADEGVYTYAAWRVANGAVPYRDFFFAHPPLHLAVPAAAFWMLGSGDPRLAKGILLGAAIVQALMVFLIVRRAAPVSCRKVANGAAVAATALLLFSLSFLLTTSYDVGVSQATAALAMAAGLSLWRRPALAGVAAACATMTALQAAPLAVTLVAGAIWFERRAGWRCLLGFLATLAAIHGLCLAVAGRAFIDQVYLFHFAKLPLPVSGWTKLAAFMRESLPLALTCVGGALAVAAADVRRRRIVLAALAGTVGHALLMATRPSVFFFYFHPMLFPMAIVAGGGLAVAIQRALADGVAASRRARMAALARIAAVLGAVFAGYTLAPARAPGQESDAGLSSTTAGSLGSTWRDAPGLGRANRFLREQFWGDGPVPGRYTNVVTRYVWAAADWSDHLVSLSATIRERARRRPDMTLFGDSTVVPWLAVETKLRIAGDLVDTNDQRMLAGYLTVAEIRRALESSADTVLILMEAGIVRLPELKAYIDERYRPVDRVYSSAGRAYTIYERRT